jgi:3-hydroxyacyl-CoA dehydrogenase
MPQTVTEIQKVAVIGAGVMGAGIAAQVANAGVPVVLLDIVKAGADDRSAIAKGAIEKLLKAEPAAFMSKSAAKLVTPGNTEDDLGLIADCDLIIEAVIERLDIKQALYARIEAARKPGSIVSSNTSTIPLGKLIEGQPETFQRDFIITHFFNPPRYMRLLEIVTGPETRPDAGAIAAKFADFKLGKSVVFCKDRPGFIANRLGVYWMQKAIVDAFEMGLDVEDVDAIIGKPMGIPKTGVFGLADLVGIDLMPHVGASLFGALPANDPIQTTNRDLPLIKKMIAEGFTGRKGKGGFYRINREKGKTKETIDLKTGDYRSTKKADVDAIKEAGKSLEALLTHDSQHGRYARSVLIATLVYAAYLIGDAVDAIDAIDESMRLGYNWKSGPFELIDQIGADRVIALAKEDGFAIPPILAAASGKSFYRFEAGKLQMLGLDGGYTEVKRPDGVIMLADIKRVSKPVLKNGSAALWDIGDGVACFEFTSKMNSLDPDTLTLLSKSVDTVAKGGQFKAMVVYNEGSNFSVGANLGLALFAINIAMWSQIEMLTASGQMAYKALKYAPFPVVGAPSGMALGGGCEILLHCHAVQAHAESYIGLVEVGVGLVPGWGGCKEMLGRWLANPKRPAGPMPAISKVFEMISTAQVSKSAAEAKEMLILRPTDGITMNRYRLLADAKAKALSMVEGHKKPEPFTYSLPGPSTKVGLDMAVDSFFRVGKATKHDVVVSGAVATILSGGPDADITKPLTEDDITALERKAFMALVRNPDTMARVEHMLETGKPLRN